MLISIITVTYNDVAGLERTIKSVQEQTATNYEHILIDGGSTDGSRALIEQHQDRFSYWASEPDNGIYHAIKKLNYYRLLKILKF
jgi:glycosyltransferase involved in cell wall biosynthesis